MKTCLTRILQDGPLWIAVGILIIALVFALYSWGIWQSLHLPITYWLFILVKTVSGRLALCYLPVLLVILIIWILSVSQLQKTSVISAVIFIMFTANVLMCVATLPVMLGQFQHRDSAQLGDKTFFLASGWKVGVGGYYPSAFMLYQCDSIGLFCEVIHMAEYEGIPLETFEVMNARLIPDQTEHTLLLEIDGKLAYSFCPE